MVFNPRCRIRLFSSFSDASIYAETPLRFGWQFKLGKNKSIYVTPLIGMAWIHTTKSNYVLGRRSFGSTYRDSTSAMGEDSSWTITESQFFRLRHNTLGLSLGAQFGYQFKRSRVQFQTHFIYNSKDWIYGEIQHLRDSKNSGSLYDQGFVYWKTAIWSASISYRYLIWKQ